MAHKEQQDFCKKSAETYPGWFSNCTVLDVGALDVNGNNREYFKDCLYTGLDVAPGPNVDIVCPIHEFQSGILYRTIICTEMLEHDPHYVESVQNMIQLLEPGGMLVLTCATTGRPEHGTARTSPTDSPLTQDKWPDYYKNITSRDLLEIPGFTAAWKWFRFSMDHGHHDLYFIGVKHDLE